MFTCETCQLLLTSCTCPWQPGGKKSIEQLALGWGNLGPWIKDIEARVQKLQLQLPSPEWREWMREGNWWVNNVHELGEKDGFEVKVIVRRKPYAESEGDRQRKEDANQGSVATGQQVDGPPKE